jgi:hypothetical protein
VLNDKGNPTPLVHCVMAPPQSRMDVISESELSASLTKSALVKKYNLDIDEESAFEMLTKKLEAKLVEQSSQEEIKQEEKQGNNEKSMIEKVSQNPVTKIIVKELARGLLGALGLGSTRKGSKKTSWF